MASKKIKLVSEFKDANRYWWGIELTMVKKNRPRFNAGWYFRSFVWKYSLYRDNQFIFMGYITMDENLTPDIADVMADYMHSITHMAVSWGKYQTFIAGELKSSKWKNTEE